MDQDLTQFQSPDDIERAEKLSREGNQPPSEVPGYEIHGMVGSGAYGEVWSGTDKNTGRKVAIKFYSRRSSVDFSLLTREVEKLASLAADRYVVQLLDVGWDASPPFYVMDFIENGSLEDELRRRGPFAIDEATEMFQEVAIGLMHLHNKGILHCDLKPGNVLLDAEQKPRLADFGQSRLSSEQVPALGTLFYMAPEQANLEAVPDARWDVYALGALMYCMLTGSPPYRTAEISDELESASEISERLDRYQTALKNAAPPVEHKEIPGMDKQLIDIIERCIAVDPSSRFENVQGILLALRQREEQRARRPLMLLGMIGPFVLLCIMSIFGFVLYNRSIEEAEDSLRSKAEDSNKWAAEFASRTASDEIDHFFESVHRLAKDEKFLAEFKSVLGDAKLTAMRQKLSDPNQNEALLEERKKFVEDETRKKLQPFLDAKLKESGVKAASWFCTDSGGTQLAFVSPSPKLTTIGKNYSFRTYFHGGKDDLKEKENEKVYYPISPDISKRERIKESHLSAIFNSEASQQWKVAFSVPVMDGDQFLGIVAATAHCGDFVAFPDVRDKDGNLIQYAILVDYREGENGPKGAILGHPLFNECVLKGKDFPEGSIYKKVGEDAKNPKLDFVDPLADFSPDFEGKWVVGSKEIYRTIFDNGSIENNSSTNNSNDQVANTDGADEGEDDEGEDDEGEDTGLVVIAVEKISSIMRPVEDLGREILLYGVVAVFVIISVGVGLWMLAIRSAKESRERVSRAFRSATETATIVKGKSTHA